MMFALSLILALACPFAMSQDHIPSQDLPREHRGNAALLGGNGRSLTGRAGYESSLHDGHDHHLTHNLQSHYPSFEQAELWDGGRHYGGGGRSLSFQGGLSSHLANNFQSHYPNFQQGLWNGGRHHGLVLNPYYHNHHHLYNAYINPALAAELELMNGGGIGHRVYGHPAYGYQQHSNLQGSILPYPSNIG